jgi:hypothetical protein
MKVRLYKGLIGIAIAVSFAFCYGNDSLKVDSANAKKADSNAVVKNERLQRPSETGASNVDAFATKSFDSYDGSLKLDTEINFYQVKSVPIKDKDTVKNVTTQYIVVNGKGEPVTKAVALKQFGELLLTAMKQNENIKDINALQAPAQGDIKSASFLKKPKLVKTFGVSNKALTYVVGETKKQIDLINQQIATIKMMKDE